MFEHLVGVERTTEFAAELAFDNEDAAGLLSMAVRSEQVPEAMRAAMRRLNLDGTKVEIEFEEVGEVELTVRDDGRMAACVLAPQEVASWKSP